MLARQLLRRDSIPPRPSMRVRTRSLVIMLGNGIVQASGILAAIILVRIVDQATFGTYRQVFLIFTTLAALLSLQLEQSLYYFVPKLRAELRQALVAQSLATATTLSFVSFATMFFGAGLIANTFDNPELVSLLRVFSIFPFVESISILVPAYMIGLDRSVRSSVYKSIKSLSRLCLVVFAFVEGAEIETVLWLLIANSGVIALVGSLDMIRLGGTGALRIDRSLFLEQIRYAAPLWLGSAVGILNLQYDKVLISTFFDPATYAVYFCGAMEVPVVMLVTVSVSSAMMPTLVSFATQGRLRDCLSLWQTAIRKCSLVIFPCFALFLPMSRDLMVLLYGEAYAAAAGPFAVYLLALPLRVAVYATLFRAMGKTRPIAWAGVLALVINVAVSTALVLVGRGTYLAFIGPSLGTVLSDFVAGAYLLYCLRGEFNIGIRKLMRWGELGRTFLLCGVAGIAIYLMALFALPPLPVPVKLGVQTVVFLAILVTAFLATGHLSRDERDLLWAPVRVVRRALQDRNRHG